jgi:sporulation protein YhbH
MSQKIDLDQRRFRKIIRGKIKDNLRKYISNGEMIARKGRETVSIPLPTVDIPRFKHGGKQQGGVGQGDGEVGDSLGQDGEEQPGGAGEAGDKAGEHVLEVDVSLQELAEILGEELELPNIEPKGSEKIVSHKDRYTGIRTTGPESLKHFRRTYKEALKRQISTGSYNKKAPLIIPIKDDKRFRSWKTEAIPHSSAVIIYMMDVSGSMGDEQKEIVRIESFWIDTWLRSQYKGIESRYIIHDAMAREVDRDTFFSTRESGGTMISSAYKLCASIMEDEYPSDEYNIYPFHFSDGDNWSVDDTVTCVDILNAQILPNSNQFAYGQVESPYGSGQFIKDLQEHFSDAPNLVTSEIKGKDAIMDSIKDFLGQGK